MGGRSEADESFLEDAVQDSLVRILDRLPQFEGRSRFVTWAMSITIRVAMTELRRRRWRDVSLDMLVGEDGLVPERAVDRAPRPDEQAEREDVLEAMRRIIKMELTDKQRTTLVAALRGMALEEVAHQMGSNRNAVYKLTHDARIRLKEGLEAAGYEADDILGAFRR
jgi:RNA polymerase sigma-70 factor, ECF subfamily